MPTAKLTNAIIEAAIDGFEGQKHMIDIQIAELRAMLSGSPVETADASSGKTKRKFSASALKRMREAQKRRWAKVRGEVSTKAPVNAAKPRRKMSASARAAIGAATKKRWAAKRAAEKR